jgi:N-acyl-D-amino-acid deacylase
MTGRAGPGLEKFDHIMHGILARYDLPGATLAIAKDGRLVLARGYGWADVATRRPVVPESLFMLASVSKSITAVTVLKLVEEGRLSLDAKVLEILRHLRPPPRHEMDPRWREITVRMLLYHAGGWSREESGDPLAQERRDARALRVSWPLTPTQLARYMLGRPLDFDPGTRADYSNFGYMLLGLIVEHFADEPEVLGVRRYEAYVRQHTLRPMDIHRMRLAIRPGHAIPAEVDSYTKEGRVAPPLLPPPHFASGAWLGSSVDLVRFLSNVDGSRGRRLLSEEITRQMFSPPPPPVPLRKNGTHFGMGWDAVGYTPEGQWYTKDGGLSGTRTRIEHRPNGVNFAVFINSGMDHSVGMELGEEMLREIRNTITEIPDWPKVDFFREYR